MLVAMSALEQLWDLDTEGVANTISIVPSFLVTL